jgi:glucose/arabinose dehydrogenase
MENIDVLYDLCEVISDEIEDSNEKIRMAGGKLTAGDVDYIDKLTHALKSIKTTIAMEEADEYSYDDGGMMDGSYARDGRGDRMMPRGGSYARGRGTNARRDSRGRYSSRGYSRAEGVKEMLKDAMNEAQTDREREAIKKALKELDR